MVLFYLGHLGRFSVDLEEDFPDYINVDFSSIHSALSSHRTLVLPLLLRIFRAVTHDPQFTYWPHFQLALFFGALAFFQRQLLRAGFRRLSAIVITSALLWNFSFTLQLNSVMTEPLAGCILLALVGCLFVAVRDRSRRSFAAVFVLTFLLYQLRPAMMYFAAFLPFLGAAIRPFLTGRPFRDGLRTFLVLLTGSLVPLLLFFLLRLAMVGQFGLVAFSGITLAMPAVGFLDDATLARLPERWQPLGAELLRRKRLLPEPCRSIPGNFEGTHDQAILEANLKADCWGTYSTLTILTEMKRHYGREPFPEPERNLEAWRYMHLGKFMSVDVVAIDQELKGFAGAVLSLRRALHLEWALRSYPYALSVWARQFFSDRFFSGRKMVWLGFLLWLGLGLGLANEARRRGWAQARRFLRTLSFARDDLLVMAFVAIPNLLIAFAMIVVVSKPNPLRYILFPSFFMPAVLWLLVFMPVGAFLRTKSTKR